jgi:HPt (histidine-containing phosphotransfer) domain-containing protein
MLDALQTMLDKWLGGDEAAGETKETAPSDEPVVTFDETRALAAVGQRHSILKRVVEAFLANVPSQIEAIKDAQAQGDHETAEREAHSVKGAAACIAAERLRQEALSVEMAQRGGDFQRAAELMPGLEIEFRTLRRALLNRPWLAPSRESTEPRSTLR